MMQGPGKLDWLIPLAAVVIVGLLVYAGVVAVALALLSPTGD
jgi:hypothetical protein